MKASPPSSLSDSGWGISRGVATLPVCAVGAGATGPAGLHDTSNALKIATAGRNARVFVMISLIEVATHSG